MQQLRTLTTKLTGGFAVEQWRQIRPVERLVGPILFGTLPKTCQVQGIAHIRAKNSDCLTHRNDNSLQPIRLMIEASRLHEKLLRF